MGLRPSKRGYGRRTLQILRMGTGTLHPYHQWATGDDHHSHGDASVDTYPNRLAMLFCLQRGKNIGSLIWIRPTDSPVQFPLFNESGRIRLKDDERIWGKVSRPCRASLLLP